MKFSVLLPIYDKEKPKNFKQCLDSIINQTVLPNQIVIVKDGILTNQLEDIIEEYEKKYTNLFKVYGYEKNKGVGYALNKGVLQCDYDYIARMDSDDIAPTKRFEIQTNYLKKHKDIDILGGYIEEYNENMTQKIVTKKVPLSQNEIDRLIGKQSPFNHGTVIFKKETVIKVGNYHNQRIEDYELWIRMHKYKCKMENLPEILGYYRTSIDMYKRRSGIKYLKTIKKIEDNLLNEEIINFNQYCKNLFIRTIWIFIPSNIKKYISPYFTRKNNM